MTHRLKVRLKGALLLGAGRSREIHDVTLRRREGEPYLPASALKGAIREQLVRLSSEDDARRILGGQGFRQDVDPQTQSPEPEAAERVGGGYTRVYLGDADLEPQAAAPFRAGLGYTVRAQVSIDRRGRRAADQRLFQRQVVGSRSEPLVFSAPLDLSLLASADLRLFEAAVRAVFAIGSSRSRGLGWVDLELAAAGPPERSPRQDEAERRRDGERGEEPTKTTELEVVFEALEPLSLGELPFVGNFQPTLDFLPASTVRGAVVTAAMRHRGITADQSGDPAFKALLLDPDRCVRFGDAMPVEDPSSPAPRIAPLSARTGKYHGEAAGVADTLVRDFIQQSLAERGVFDLLRDEVAGGNGKTERASRPGRWLGARVPERRVMTRVALEPASARGRDGALYSVELLERGQSFVGPVMNAGPEAHRLLADAAAVDLRAGHGRGQGYGRLRIVEIRARRDEPLRDRLAAFDAHVRARIAAAAKRAGVELPAEASRYLAALLVTELVPAGDTEGASAEDTFHAALGLVGSRLLHAVVRSGQRGGFDTTHGRPRPFGPVVQAGSVLLLTVPEFDSATLDRLTALERHGAGEARDRGFGTVRFSDPIHLEGDHHGT